MIQEGLGGMRNASWGFLGDLANHVKNGSKGNSAHNRDLNVWMPGQYWYDRGGKDKRAVMEGGQEDTMHTLQWFSNNMTVLRGWEESLQYRNINVHS